MSGASSEFKGRGGKRRHVWKSGGSADYAALDGTRIMGCLATIAAAGGAVRFGYTSDGGAYALGVYGDGEKPYTEYLKPGDPVEDYLESLAASFGPDHPELPVIENGRLVPLSDVVGGQRGRNGHRRD